MWRRSSIGAFVAVLAALVAVERATAQEHMRGTLEAVDGRTLTIATDAGQKATVALNEDAGLFVVSEGTRDDIRTGQFVGITSIDMRGHRVAIEVHIFEESLRGLAEGHYPWDLVAEPNMMTNANIAWVVGLGKDQQMKLEFKNKDGTSGWVQIEVPPEAKVVQFNPATMDKLVPGRDVFLLVVKKEDGSLASPAIVVGAEGVTPPM